MKILMINVVCGIRSTGRICTDLAIKLESQGHEVKIAYGREDVPEQFKKYAVRIGTDLDVKLHGVKARLFDGCGFGSKKATEKFIEWVKEYNPDVIHLHNIHGYYINVEVLFNYLRTCGKKIIWTLHDCWAFTGHCTYFTAAKCDKWKTKCSNCPQKKEYPASLFLDRSEYNYTKKKSLFTDINNLSLIVPSKWLKDLVKDSFLSEYPIEVVYNTIDTSVFKPSPSDFKEKYDIQDKIMILGVASTWSKRKGLDDFIKLAQILDDKYVIALVGLNDKQIKELPNYIKVLVKTYSPDNLATVYSCSDFCVNTSKEEPSNFKDEHEDITIKEFTRNNNGIVIPQDVSCLYEAITGNKYEKTSGKVCSKFICLRKTNNTSELAQIYTAADYFVNPTYEDNYPTVNLEAVACGTKVIAYDTGGCKETIGIY